MPKLALPILLALLFSSPAAYAQSYDFTPLTNGLDIHLSNQNFNDAIDRAIDNAGPEEGLRSTPIRPTNRATSLAAAKQTFAASKSHTRTNLQNFVNKTRAVDPAGADQMAALFASTDIIGQIGSVMSRFGLSSNNAVDAFALYWISAWQAVHRDSSTPSAVMAKSVSAQAAKGLLQSPEFTEATDAQKQEMAEALMVQAAMIEASVEQAGSDREQLKAVGKAIAQGAAASGLELDRMTLTEDGFVEGGPRKTGDASDLAADDANALASTDSKGADGISNGQLALFAAVGDAGLAGVFLFGKATRKTG